MKNKICLITGANAGIGFETAKALSSKGFKVILVCRTEEKAKMAMEKILIGHAEAELDYALADLSSQAEIRNLAKNIITKYPVLDVLINNAGIWYSDMQLTADGIERQWAINHLAPFLYPIYYYPPCQKPKIPELSQ